MPAVIDGATGVDRIKDGIILAADLAAGAVEGAMVTASTMRNKLINGSFLWWQRAQSFSVGGSWTYTADRWAALAGGANVTVQVAGNDLDNSLVITGAAGNTVSYLTQRIESCSIRNCAGKVMTFSGWIYGSDNTTVNRLVSYAGAPDNFSSPVVVGSGLINVVSGVIHRSHSTSLCPPPWARQATGLRANSPCQPWPPVSRSASVVASLKRVPSLHRSNSGRSGLSCCFANGTFIRYRQFFRVRLVQPQRPERWLL